MDVHSVVPLVGAEGHVAHGEHAHVTLAEPRDLKKEDQMYLRIRVFDNNIEVQLESRCILPVLYCTTKLLINWISRFKSAHIKT